MSVGDLFGVNKGLEKIDRYVSWEFLVGHVDPLSQILEIAIAGGRMDPGV
jgi:hypothetical protein